ncbi:MAG: hypothetical protein NZM31_03435 [Gemmatales bacterium]|nr:hypothetical protein [Gemmatales bacterium]MDW8386051.1 hypothetical protein [Gemmatales bacterium]
MNREQTVAPDAAEAWITEAQRLWTTDWLAEASVDRSESVVRNVALLGPQSRNGYRYTLEAMQQAVPLYEGRPVFVDHGQANTAFSNRGFTSPPWPSRSIRDYAGQVRQPRFDNGRIRGDLHLAGPNADWLLDLIAAAPTDIGMSHVVLARRRRHGDEIEQIEQVVSVDIVAFPATTRSFSESMTALPYPHGNFLADDWRREDLPPPLAAEIRRLLALLENLTRISTADVPSSRERLPSGAALSAAFRKAFVAAIRGR